MTEFNINKRSAFELMEMNLLTKDELRNNEEYFLNHVSEYFLNSAKDNEIFKDLIIKKYRSNFN